jgi:phosphoserine phosphatase RsbU/P
MIRALLIGLIAGQAMAQSRLYIDISDGWSFVGPSARGKVNIGVASGTPRALINQTGTIERSVEIPDWADRNQLALTIGPVRERYTVIVNGQRIARVGTEGTLADANLPQTRTFPIPASVVGLGGLLDILVDLDRRATTPPWRVPLGYHPALITYRSNAPMSAGEDEIALQRLRLMPCLVFAVVFLLLGAQVLVAWLRERNRTELLWFAAALLLAFAYDFLIYANTTPHSTPYNDRYQYVFTTARFAAFASFVIAALRIRLRWLHAGIWLLWLGLEVYLASGRHFLSYTPFVLYRIFSLVVWTAAFAAGVAGWRRTFVEKATFQRHLFVVLLLLNSAYGLLAAGSYVVSIGRGIQEYTFAGGYYFLHYDAFTLILAISILMLLLQQVASDRRQRQRLASEMNAARSAQQFLLGQGASVEAGGFVIDPVYEPATEVGGDFYQILPLPDGALLVAVGDVSGKGLKAAMVVSMVIGLVRSHAALPPGALLGHINRAIAGRLDGGFVTCAVLRMEKDGRGLTANAGHPAMYCDGREAPVDPVLPLGIDPEAAYAEASLEASTITLVSDGVVEAANPKGELFGFDRTREMSTKSAQTIAEAAKAWGQNDDITVVTVKRASA